MCENKRQIYKISSKVQNLKWFDHKNGHNIQIELPEELCRRLLQK